MVAPVVKELVAPVEAEETLAAHLVGTPQENLMLFTTVVKEILELLMREVIQADLVDQAFSLFQLENHTTSYTEIVEDLAVQAKVEQQEMQETPALPETQVLLVIMEPELMLVLSELLELTVLAQLAEEQALLVI
jgi:hypothetical protein